LIVVDHFLGTLVMSVATACIRSLVIDDNVDAARTLSRVMDMLGADSVVASNPLEAIDLATRFKPDIILLDLCMPGMDGFAVAKRLRELSLPPFLLAALTGRADAQSLCDPDDFQYFMVKPAEIEALRALVDAARELQRAR
jgi:CheY-like chemotaxis protein